MKIEPTTVTNFPEAIEEITNLSQKQAWIYISEHLLIHLKEFAKEWNMEHNQLALTFKNKTKIIVSSDSMEKWHTIFSVNVLPPFNNYYRPSIKPEEIFFINFDYENE